MCRLSNDGGFFFVCVCLCVLMLFCFWCIQMMWQKVKKQISPWDNKGYLSKWRESWSGSGQNSILLTLGRKQAARAINNENIRKQTYFRMSEEGGLEFILMWKSEPDLLQTRFSSCGDLTRLQVRSSQWSVLWCFLTGSGPDSCVGSQGVPLSIWDRHRHSNWLLPIHLGNQHRWPEAPEVTWSPR